MPEIQHVVARNGLTANTPYEEIYWGSVLDSEGKFLTSDKKYTMTFAKEIPYIAPGFWSITLYDPATRCLLPTSQPFPTVSSLQKPTQNPDGSVDIVIGPDKPDDSRANWIATDPAKGWFAMFRFYGPLRGYIDRSWKLGDLSSKSTSSSHT